MFTINQPPLPTLIVVNETEQMWIHLSLLFSLLLGAESLLYSSKKSTWAVQVGV